MRLKRCLLLIGAGLTLSIGSGAYLYGRMRPVSPVSLVDEGTGCAACHADQVDGWRVGAHRELGCFVCHGSPGDHVVEKIAIRPRMLVRGPEHCLHCHLRREGEPEEPPRIDGLTAHLEAIEKKHVTTIDRDRVGGTCSFCHEPHLME